MQGTVSNWLASVQDQTSRRALQVVLSQVADRLSSQVFASANVQIFAGSSPNAKTGIAAVPAVASGSLLNIAANTNLPVAAITTPQSTFNAYVFYVNPAGTVSCNAGTPGTALAAVRWPDTPNGSAIIGGFTVNPTGAAFIGGTTALDAANTNVSYFSPVGAVDPSIIVGNY